GGKPLAMMPLYVKSHSYGEYVFDHAWADAFDRAGGHYYPKLQASVPFTPVTRRRLLIDPYTDVSSVYPLLLQTAASAVAQTETSSLHITFMTETEWRAAEKEGFLLRTDKQYHWENRGYESFDGFLAELSSSKRKNLRKERAAVLEDGV